MNSLPKPEPKFKHTIYLDDGKIAGFVFNGVYFKGLKPEHFLRKPPGIALDIGALAEAERYGARVVCVTNVQSGDQWRAEIAHIREVGIPINRGYGEQLALPFDGWIKTRQGRLNNYRGEP